ncbi:MAG: hypothetical protein JSW71_10005 [Gemmatimonadota bacterium]|nr:MAG: hypothetical protein JSW71_10005 [Gemmatimonadota bacterium]
MRTMLAAVFGLVTLTSPAMAQRQFVGLTGGATLSDFGNISSSSRWGGTAGVTVGYRTFHWSAVSLEGTWVQRGDENIRLDYIDIPLLIGGVAQAGGGDLRTRFYSGINVGFKISCNAKTDRFICDNAKGTQWFIPFGLMVGRWTRQGTFVAVDVRYLLGLADAFNLSSVYNRGWQFKLVVGRSVGR